MSKSNQVVNQIVKQENAFFAYSKELNDYCINNLEGLDSINEEPDSIRLHYTGWYAIRKSSKLTGQRPYLPDSEFYAILCIKDLKARIKYITHLYQEMYDKELNQELI